MIKKKTKKTITDFSKAILKLIKNKDERYINILSIETVNIMNKISKDHTLVGDNIYLDIYYDDKKIVGGVYGLINGSTISDLHSIIFEPNSYVAKSDLARSYKNIMKTFRVVIFNVVKGSDNEIFHDSMFKRYGKYCEYQFKQSGGTYKNINGETKELVRYKAKLIK